MVRTSRGADSESEKNVKEKLRLFRLVGLVGID